MGDRVIYIYLVLQCYFLLLHIHWRSSCELNDKVCLDDDAGGLEFRGTLSRSLDGILLSFDLRSNTSSSINFGCGDEFSLLWLCDGIDWKAMLVAVVFPCVCYFMLHRGRLTKLQIATCIMIIIVGVVCSIIGAYSAISRIAEQSVE
ncbi:hypothetical protein TB2_032242 [Malus domestica]